MESIIDILIEYTGTNCRMDSIALEDAKYQKSLVNIDSVADKIQINSDIDKLISAYNAANTYYIRNYYQQGLIDCVAFLKEIHLTSKSIYILTHDLTIF